MQESLNVHKGQAGCNRINVPKSSILLWSNKKIVDKHPFSLFLNEIILLPSEILLAL
jgi:hypothetical protein